MKIKFETTANVKIEGAVVGDFGHAFDVRVEKASRRKLVGKTMLFSKAHMISCKTEG